MSSLPVAASPLLSLVGATIRRFGHEVLTDIDWTIRQSENWAIVGPNGSGKTTLLESLAGKLSLGAGRIEYSFWEEKKHSGRLPEGKYAWDFIRMVPAGYSFSRLSHAPDQYYQQRFHSMDSEDFPLTEAFLLNPEGLEEETTVAARAERLREVASLLNITHLLDRKVVKLSNGETKRVLLTQALLDQPDFLLLDNPFVGLDTQSRGVLREAIEQITRMGVHLILATSPTEIPTGITHVLELEKGGVAGTYDRPTFLKEWASRKLVYITQSASGQPLIPHAEFSEEPAFHLAVQMNHVHVQYGEVKVLDDLNWTVNRGEKWAVLGPNGSGKSTLLSLINGDNPQAYANSIILFDRKKGSGESIWDIKRKIGYVSPELHAYYPKSATCLEAILSGFYDTLHLTKNSTPEQVRTAEAYLQLLGLEAQRDTSLRQLSTGEQRLVLVARALVKHPPLLILDEPCQGLDESYQYRIKRLLEQTGNHPLQTMIYVTHYLEEIPACVHQVLRLKAGKVESITTF